MMDPADLLTRWEGVRAGLLATIATFGDDGPSLTPYPGAWSVQRLPLHSAQEEHGTFSRAIARTLAQFSPNYPTELCRTVAARCRRSVAWWAVRASTPALARSKSECGVTSSHSPSQTLSYVCQEASLVRA
jgi:hypothetical protein